VWTLSKALRSPIVDPMTDWDLFREFELYAAAEGMESRRQQAQQQRQARAARGVAGRRHR
jgi:hypothetical protein